MPKDLLGFDAAAARAAWDQAAEAWDRGQASGRDYYRHEFFGPVQVEMCGDVGGKLVLDVGCGNGYFSREMARLHTDQGDENGSGGIEAFQMILNAVIRPIRLHPPDPFQLSVVGAGPRQFAA